MYKSIMIKLLPLFVTLFTLNDCFAQRPNPNANTDGVATKWINLAYGEKSKAQKLDIYLPNEGKGPFPVIVAIHGGAFIIGDKADRSLNPMLEGLNLGYAIVSINYRLSGEAKFPAQIYDVKAAIRFIKENANKYNLKASKIGLWGGSAGGHLASLAGTSGGVKELEEPDLKNPQSSSVQAVVDWFGPINFLEMHDQKKKKGLENANDDNANSAEAKLIGKKFSDAPDLVKMASPATYISKDDPPFFIQHGTADKLIPSEQSINFAAALEKVIGKEKVTLILLEGANHGDRQFKTKENLNKVFKFLDKYLK